MTAAGNILIEARALTRTFTGGGGLLQPKSVVHAVDNVDLSVLRGETLAIVGESGCGKSTLARTLVRLLEPTAGQVLYEGRDIGHLPEPEIRRLRKDVQFVFQDPFSSLNPRMTVEAIVGEPLTVHTRDSRAERRRKVADLLRRVGLRPSMANRYPHEFSGGQRQRIGIARALASAPKVIVADEPVSALDVSVQAQVINLLEDLKAEFDLTLVLIAHDLAVIRHMSDRVAVMYLGEVVECGRTDSVYDTPRHPYTRALMSAIPVPAPGIRSARVELKGDIPSPLAPPSGCRFHTRCPGASNICASTRPVPETGADGRQISCHNWRSLAGEAFPQNREPARGAAAARRFALYRARSEQPQGERPQGERGQGGQASGPGTGPDTESNQRRQEHA